MFDQVGGWPEEFRFVHEGIDLAWRVMDAGYRVEYLGDTGCAAPGAARRCPRATATPSTTACGTSVWLARRHLPLPLGVVYALSFALRGAVRLRSAGDARALAKGLRDGVRAAVRHAPAPERAHDLAHDARRAARPSFDSQSLD